VVDRLQSVLTKFYLAGEGPEWRAIWDQVSRDPGKARRPARRPVSGARRGAPGRRSIDEAALIMRPTRGIALAMADGSRRFPPPWRADKVSGGYVVRDASGQALAYLYGRETEADARQAKVLTNDEARRIAINIARLPELLGKAGD
jgi:hypothetical protein